MGQIERNVGYVETLLAPITLTAAATGNSQTTQTVASVPVGPVMIKDPLGCVQFVLTLTAAATLVGDTADITVQTLIGGFWLDVLHFPQLLGNGGIKTYVGKISMATVVTMFEVGTALGANAQRDLFGDQWAIKWALVGTGSFTLSIVAIPN